MSSLTFPSLHDTPLLPFSPLLQAFWRKTAQGDPLHDIATVISEYLVQNSTFAATSAKRGIPYVMLEERSSLLQDGVSAIVQAYDDHKAQLGNDFAHDNFTTVLGNMQRVYAHPVLTSLWLGLEQQTHTTHSVNDEAVYYAVHASSHYPNEIAAECKTLFAHIEAFGDTDAVVVCLNDASANAPLSRHRLQQFIVDAAPLCFTVAASGRMPLVGALLEMMNATLTWLDNKRMQQSYLTVLSGIKRLSHATDARKAPIFATNPPIFDAHIPCGEVRMKVDDDAYKTGIITLPTHAIDETFVVVYNKLRANLELIVQYRGRLTGVRTRAFADALAVAVQQQDNPMATAQYCRCLVADWQRWMITQFDDEDVLMQECSSLTAALIAKIADKGTEVHHA